jgi:RNA polymerase sigma factor (sigma-70 family)
MSPVKNQSVVRQIGSLFDGLSVAGLTDRQLIEQFTRARDAAGEAAFAALVRRHGPMVLHICRQLLGNLQDAEDAFQAVFLVLARKAPSIGDPDLLANWLYGVALRTAKKARIRLARRRRNEEFGSMRCRGSGSSIPIEPAVEPAGQTILSREHAEILHYEINRLPQPFRLPIVLYYFEGLTLDEAAHRLRCPAGTVRSRLARACVKLRRGLTRRGVALSGAGLAAALSSTSASASISSRLCDITTQAAIHFAAGRAAPELAAALAQEVLRSMLLQNLKFIALTVLVLVSVATGAGYTKNALTMRNELVNSPAGQQLRSATKLNRPDRVPSPGRMFVAGRVLDPAGKPLEGVPVDIMGKPRAPQVSADQPRDYYILLGHGATDDHGSFRLEASRTSSGAFFEVFALAASPGFGFGWVLLNADAEQPAADIRLQPEQVIRGKLVDVNGQPAVGVEVQLKDVFGMPLAANRWNFMQTAPVEGLRAWPKPVTTDERGRFAFAGIGRGLHVSFDIRDARFARQSYEVQTDDRDGPKEVSLALHPATIIEGRTLAADTGQLIPNAVITVWASFGGTTRGTRTKFRTDDRGRFKINPSAGDYFRLHVLPPEGQPYLATQDEFAWPKGAIRKEIDLKLPRGVLIQGNVIEEGTGRPVSGASVQFFPTKESELDLGGFQAIVASREDGSFRVAVPPGKGHLMVLAPTLDYLPKEIGGAMLLGGGRPGGWRFYAHDIIAYEVKASEMSHMLTAALKPGKTVRGRVVGPKGQAVNDAVILTRQQVDPTNLVWLCYSFIHAYDGRFELHGFDPENPAPVYFLDVDHQWGAAIELSGKQAGEELTVRLQPCGHAKARFVDPNGKPLAKLGLEMYFQVVMTPGPNRGFMDRGEPLAADAAYLPSVDPKHYNRQRFATDAEGRVTMPTLIPGAPYRLSDWSTINVQAKGYQLRKQFTVKPGETIELGDIVVEKPGE